MCHVRLLERFFLSYHFLMRRRWFRSKGVHYHLAYFMNEITFGLILVNYNNRRGMSWQSIRGLTLDLKRTLDIGRGIVIDLKERLNGLGVF